MLGKNLTVKQNPYLVTTLVTVSSTAALSIVKYALGKQFDLTEALAFAVVFWIVYFSIQHWLTKRLEKKTRDRLMELGKKAIPVMM